MYIVKAELGSQEQTILKQKIQALLSLSDSEIREDYRPHWLKNRKTGKPLEIDLFLQHLGIGIEYQGHDSHFKCDNVKYRDELKHQILAQSTRRFPVVIVEIFRDDIFAEDFQKTFYSRILRQCGDVIFRRIERHLRQKYFNNLTQRAELLN